MRASRLIAAESGSSTGLELPTLQIRNMNDIAEITISGRVLV
jgi:hypothetical protein